MRRLPTTLATGLALAMVPSLGLPAAGAAPARTLVAANVTTSAAATVCTQAVVFAVPGNGEGDATATGSTGAGRTLRPVLDRLESAASAADRSVEVRTVYLDTPGASTLRGRGTRATPATKAVTRASWRAWREQVPDLTTALRGAVESALATCPDQLVQLVGYAQGAEAVHRLLAAEPDNELRRRTAAVTLVADPARVAGSRGSIIGDPAAPRTAQGVGRRYAAGVPAVPAPGFAPPVHSVCSRRDVACDFTAAPFRVARAVHLSYHRDPMTGRMTNLGQQLGTRLALWPVPAVDQQISGRVGLVLSEKLGVSIARDARPDLRWRATSALPPGLELSNRGRLTGSPEVAGNYEIDYTVRNASSTAVSRPMPGRVAVNINPEPPSQTSAGGRHTCTVRADGSLWCWGANYYGQLGVGDRASGPTPRQVGSRTDWASVSSGGMHTCATRETGTLWCWGLNYRGQLGIGSRKDRMTPARVGDRSDWASVSAGWVHSCGTLEGGSAWCWGNNAYGQLGDGTRQSSPRPARVSRIDGWTDVEAGGWHTCGVAADGAALCWGRNLNGQLGDGTLTGRTRPTRIGQDTDWVSLQPSWNHTCGLKSTASISCWGANEAAQLGSAGGASPTPKLVAGGHTWSRLAVGAGSSCAIDDGRDLWCWGTGRYGQLGGSTTRSASPVLVYGEQSWVDLDAGWLHACGQRSTGLPQCWGNNENGQRGQGASPARTVSANELDGAREQDPARRTSAAQRAAGYEFNLVTYNVLGSNHTTPRRDAGEFTPARIRSEWAVDYLREIGASIVGFQELQRDQLTWFVGAAGDQYNVWPGTSLGGKGVQTTIAWKQRAWRLLQTDHVAIPFIKDTRWMPLVKLQHRTTGRKIWVMNVHNAPRDYQSQRNEAVRREIARLKDVVGKGAPVFLTGDFNERHRAFCEVTGKLNFVAPRGGSNDNGNCQPPQGLLRVDWIFGSRNVQYSGYRQDRSPMVQLMTDHAILRTHVTVP